MATSSYSLIFKAFAILAFVFIAYRWFFPDRPHNQEGVVVINQETGIEGEVTGYNSARGFKIYINSTPTPYNFDLFVNQELAPNNSLGYYIKSGDFISKKPNSNVLMLKRGAQESSWQFDATNGKLP